MMFRKGDLVRHTDGWTVLKVSDVYRNPPGALMLRVQLNPQGGLGILRPAMNFVHYNPRDTFVNGNAIINPFDKETENMATNLYTWKDADGVQHYGTRIGTNSQGYWVMDPKGGGAPHAVTRDAVEKVVPYSVGVKFNGSGSTYDYWVDPAAGLKVGAYVLTWDIDRSPVVVQVVAVDTKSDKASKWLEGVVLAGEPLKAGDA